MQQRAGRPNPFPRLLFQLAALGGPWLLRQFLLAIALSLAGAALLSAGLIALRYGWRQAFAPWSFDAPGRPVLIGLWQGEAEIEGQRRRVLLNLGYRYWDP